tara:strand:- start:718 stop:1485 length:768 start_codon:yes stop_codon:yes gene_type:complete
MSNISYLAIKTICFRKIKDFFSEFQHTIISPLLSISLFILILTTISSYYKINYSNINFLNFLIPGIILMMIMQISYQNISENLIHMKQIGSFNDYLISPISRIEILISLIISSIIISFFMGFLSILIYSFFINIYSINIILFIYYIFITSLIFSSLGAIVGFLFFTWDIQSSFSNFIVIPISFLSGTFYDINSLNNGWKFILKYNPFYYIIDNFRMSFNNEYHFNIKVEFFLLTVSFLFFLITIYIYKKGFKVIN